MRKKKIRPRKKKKLSQSEMDCVELSKSFVCLGLNPSERLAFRRSQSRHLSRRRRRRRRSSHSRSLLPLRKDDHMALNLLRAPLCSPSSSADCWSGGRKTTTQTGVSVAWCLDTGDSERSRVTHCVSHRRRRSGYLSAAHLGAKKKEHNINKSEKISRSQNLIRVVFVC